jgi:hypothetical protein
MQQIENLKFRSTILINENSVDFNRTMGRNFILGNDTYLTYNPNFSDQNEMNIYPSNFEREIFNQNFYDMNNNRPFGFAFDNQNQSG